MDRYLKMSIFIMAVIISINFNSCALQANNSKNEKRIITQEQAAEHAAELANEQCQKEFGLSPFKPETYKAQLVDTKWHWGNFKPVGVFGYSAKVEFCKDGSDEDVRVVFHTDAIDNRYRLKENEETIKKTEKLEKILPELPE